MTSERDLEEELRTLNEISIALSSERELDTLLDRIVREAMNLTRAEGGSLYIVEEDQLRFAVMRNDVLDLHSTSPGTSDEPVTLPVSSSSISGYVAQTGDVINIDDAYDLPDDSPYTFDASFDEEHNYRTKSLLGLPLHINNENVLGVLLLVNARDAGDDVTSFPEEKTRMIRSLASQAGVAIHNAQLNEELKESYLESIQRLSLAAEYKDPDTADHIQRMSHYSRRIVKEIGWSDDRAERMLYASPMHDIGKIGVPDQVLQKPGSLTDEEYEQMKGHTVIGHRILSGSDNDIMELSARIALTHHEKWDGTGYPEGLSGEEIPIEGRVVAIADVFDALTTERPYKEPFSVEKSLDIIHDDRGSHFDPELVDVFDRCLDDILDIRDRFDDGDSAD
jgi:HD-GYP domain-containing protein (c-di-GMP phosphodiesterase class II)